MTAPYAPVAEQDVEDEAPARLCLVDQDADSFLREGQQDAGTVDLVLHMDPRETMVVIGKVARVVEIDILVHLGAPEVRLGRDAVPVVC